LALLDRDSPGYLLGWAFFELALLSHEKAVIFPLCSRFMNGRSASVTGAGQRRQVYIWMALALLIYVPTRIWVCSEFSIKPKTFWRANHFLTSF